MRMAMLMGTAGVALLATTGFAQEVSYDYDRTADFTKLKTYAWTGGRKLNDELNHKRIVAAIDAQLAVKGLGKVEPNASPDVLVTYDIGFARDLQIRGYQSGWAGYRTGARYGSARTEQILVGALAVDLMDAKTRSTLWHATATRDVDADADPEKREKNINKTAEKLFEKFPPTGK
jgi:hypothetical protein